MADFKHIIRNFSGGILEDKREQSPNHFSITKHFDTFSYPTKLVPYAKTITSLGFVGGLYTITQLNIVKFAYALKTTSAYSMYGLGVDPLTGHTAIYSFDIDAGAPNTTSWDSLANGISGTAGRDTNVFFHYKNYLYNLQGGTTLQRADVFGIQNFNDSYQSITYTTGVQPVHHPSDDIAYFFGDNIVHKLDNTTWSGSVLTLPSNEQITCASPHGNYLAIGTVTKGNVIKKSTVYLWDRDSSLTTLTDRIDFGEGKIKYLASLNNKLIGMVDYYTDSTYSLNKGKLLVKQQSGEFAVNVNEITTDTANAAIPASSVVKDNKLYFAALAQLNGDTRLGVWAVDDSGKVNFDTYEPSATSIDGLFNVANIWWIAHSTNGSVTHTDANSAYSSSNPSIYESLILSTVAVTNRGTIIQNAATTKKFIGATVMTEPLTSGQSVTLKYRVDSNLSGSWTTLFTNSTVGSTNHTTLNIESTGANLPTYNEIQFRVESLGGAVVTGLEYAGDVVPNQIFD